MKKMMKAAIGFAALASLVAGGPVPAIADDHHGGHQDEHHQEHQDVHRVQAHRHWHKGGGIEHEDWDRAQRIDYREHHLHEPPPGYEWRQVGPNFILAAVATGVIASIIAAGH
jgi:Ni/Co efflux regulator RcnB